MKKEILNYTLNEQMKKEKDELLSSLKKEPLIIAFLDNYQVEEQVFTENVYQLKDYVQRAKLCEGCLGLAFCRQDNEGLVLSPSYADDISFDYIPCKFKQQQHQDLEHMRYITINDMSEDQLKHRFKDMEDEDENRSKTIIMSEIRFIQDTQAKGLYLYGEPGVGKTHILTCFANDMASKHYKVAFVHVPKLIADLKTLMTDNTSFKRHIYALRHVDCLILDDIGGESASSWSRDDILLPILNERMEHHRQTFFTSNYSLHDLEVFYTLKSRIVNDKVGAKRLVERIRALSDEKVLKGKNRRVENSSN